MNSQCDTIWRTLHFYWGNNYPPQIRVRFTLCCLKSLQSLGPPASLLGESQVMWPHITSRARAVGQVFLSCPPISIPSPSAFLQVTGFSGIPFSSQRGEERRGSVWSNPWLSTCPGEANPDRMEGLAFHGRRNSLLCWTGSVWPCLVTV